MDSVWFGCPPPILGFMQYHSLRSLLFFCRGSKWIPLCQILTGGGERKVVGLSLNCSARVCRLLNKLFAIQCISIILYCT